VKQLAEAGREIARRQAKLDKKQDKKNAKRARQLELKAGIWQTENCGDDTEEENTQPSYKRHRPGGGPTMTALRDYMDRWLTAHPGRNDADWYKESYRYEGSGVSWTGVHWENEK
jgi:hypothetical protein